VIGIGKGLRTKVNANLGTSYDYVNVAEEVEKLKVAMEAGADTVMDLSTGGNLRAIRQTLMAVAEIPLGSVPVYEAELVVSRGGGLLAAWMMYHNRENPLYERFDDILDIMRTYDVTVSLGDSLRPGSIADSFDRPQIHELLVLGELVDRSRKAGVQVMVEGPGHVPLNEIEAQVLAEKKICKGAPFYVLGPLPTDVGAGWDHITGAIGGALAAAAGVDFLCYVTPAEHLGLPTPEHVRAGVIAFRIAAHIGDIVKGVKGAYEWDLAMSRARYALDWEAQLRLALDPVKAREIFEQRASKTEACSMLKRSGRYLRRWVRAPDAAIRTHKKGGLKAPF